MLDLQNCNFLRDTFMTITSRYCPSLEHHLLIVNVGLGFISAGIMLCLILWLVYANRPQREEVFVKTSSIKSSRNRLDDLRENRDGHVSIVSLVVTSPARVAPDIENYLWHCFLVIFFFAHSYLLSASGTKVVSTAKHHLEFVVCRKYVLCTTLYSILFKTVNSWAMIIAFNTCFLGFDGFHLEPIYISY